MSLGREKKHSQEGSRRSVLINRRQHFGSEQDEEKKNALVCFVTVQRKDHLRGADVWEAAGQ